MKGKLSADKTYLVVIFLWANLQNVKLFLFIKIYDVLIKNTAKVAKLIAEIRANA